ncbi:MAG TPA: Holliday junction resolvase-like protein [Victivallales bacterium]|nr:Holliday junction resolvase-like protein [Victivallales bacterium]
MQINPKRLIQQLESSNFYLKCPSCGEEFAAKKAGLFYLNDFTPDGMKRYEEMKAEIKERELDLRESKKKIKIKSAKAAESINIGFISERLAPILKDFKFNHNDCRAMGEPIDYIIFEGLSKNGTISKLFFVDIKTGNARLNKHQKNIKEIVEKKKIEFDTYKVKK